MRTILPLPPSVEQYAERLQLTMQWARAVHGEVRQEREERGRSLGRVVTVIGSKGGVGTSLVALVAAKYGAKLSRTALVDFDLRGGDLASYCGLRVRHSVIDLAAIAAEVGGREVSEVSYRVRGGIELFPAPEHGERAEEMTEAAARQIIQALRYQYDRVIIDAGSRVEEAMAAALDLSDEIVVVATPEAPALRGVRRLRATMERLELGHGTPVRLLLNRASRKAEIQPAPAAKLAGVELLAALPEATARLEPALNTADLLDAQIPAFTAAAHAVGTLTDPLTPVTETAVDLEPEELAERGNAKPKRRKSRGFGRGKHAEEGGVAVEFVGGIMISIMLLFLFLQMVLLGATALLAHDSAQEAARDFAVGMSHSEVTSRVSQRLPGGLASHLSISRAGGTVTVTLGFPGAWPGVGPVDAKASIQKEE